MNIMHFVSGLDERQLREVLDNFINIILSHFDVGGDMGASVTICDGKLSFIAVKEVGLMHTIKRSDNFKDFVLDVVGLSQGAMAKMAVKAAIPKKLSVVLLKAHSKFPDFKKVIINGGEIKIIHKNNIEEIFELKKAIEFIKNSGLSMINSDSFRNKLSELSD